MPELIKLKELINNRLSQLTDIKTTQELRKYIKLLQLSELIIFFD